MIHFWYMGYANCALYGWMGFGQRKQDQIHVFIMPRLCTERQVVCFFLGKGNNYGGLRKYRKSFCVHDEWRKHW